MLFSADLSEVKKVYNILKYIAIKEHAVFRPLKEGLKITVHEMTCMEISAHIPSNIFSDYYVNDNEKIVMFRISLKTLLEILNIFGEDSNPSLKMKYQSYQHPLCIIMQHEEVNVTIDCEITTMNLDNLYNPNLSELCNFNKIIMNGNVFAELLHGLDNSAEELRIIFNSDFPHFVLKTISSLGESEVNINKFAESVMIYECKKPNEYTYNFDYIRHVIKIINNATKVAILNGESGLLGLQLSINMEEYQMFVECYVTSICNLD